MGNIIIPENPNFSAEVEEFLTTTPAHADEFNKRLKALLEDLVYLNNNKFDKTKIVESLNITEPGYIPDGIVVAKAIEDVKNSTSAGCDGVNLNMTFAQLKAKIATGDFSGLHLYDYIDFTMNGGEAVRAEIMGFNTMLYFGDTMVTKPHVLMQFRDCLATAYKYNDSNTNTGGYDASALKNTMENTIYNALPADLRGAILTCPRLESTKGGWGWKARNIFLPTEVEVFGNVSWSEPGYGTGSSKQWEGYATSYKHVLKGLGKGAADRGSRCNWWLSVPYASNATNFCRVANYGYAGNDYASYAYGVAPAFLIG